MPFVREQSGGTMTVSTYVQNASGGRFSVALNVGDLIIVGIDGDTSPSASGGDYLGGGYVRINSNYATYTRIYRATDTTFSFSSSVSYYSYWVITN